MPKTLSLSLMILFRLLRWEVLGETNQLAIMFNVRMINHKEIEVLLAFRGKVFTVETKCTFGTRKCTTIFLYNSVLSIVSFLTESKDVVECPGINDHFSGV